MFPNHNTKPNTGELVLSFIIVLSVISLINETEQSIYKKYKFFFSYSTIFFFIFSVEYILRLIFCGKISKYRGLKGKLKYLISPIAIIDLIAILPNIIMFFVQNFTIVTII